MTTRSAVTAIAALLALVGRSEAQVPGDTVAIAPGAQYSAGPVYRWLMGTGYRDLWTTPIRVPVADLDRYAGGLTPVRVGGGMTTRTLHLDGKDGRRYVFRSVDKEPVDLIEDFVGTPIEAILRDQISSFNPSGALVVPALLDAVGVLHVNPRLVVVPDDPRLGEFRAEFAGMLALFEERPDDVLPGSEGFAGSSEIVQTDGMFERFEEDPRHHVAVDELLRARLVDLIVGDRDRSTNNLLFARFDDGDGGYLWRPVPRDRDQAFVKLDGVLKGIARNYEPRLVDYGEEYSSIAGLTRNAWDIDRTFLVAISAADWSRAVADVQRSLSDDVIDAAVRGLPDGHFEILGPDLVRALRARRDALDEAAAELYRIVFRYSDIGATDSADVAEVERFADGSVRVAVRTPTGPPGRAYERTFLPDETREVRLYLHGGDDSVTVSGQGRPRIRVRLIGGGGQDRFVDRSDTGFGGNSFYDAGASTLVVSGPGSRWHRRTVERRFSWHEESRDLDWGHSWLPEPGFSYDGDRGLVLRSGLIYTRYGFTKSPYSSQIHLRVGWSFGLSEPLVEYQHDFRGVLAGADMAIRFRWSGLDIIDFYGLGNESVPSGPTAFHRTPHKRIELATELSFGDGSTTRLSIGPSVQYISTDTTREANYLAAVRPYGSGRFGQAALQATFERDTRDRSGTPSSGYRVEGGGAYFPEFMGVDQGEFGEVHGQAAFFLSPVGTNPTLAFRAQGKKLWGVYPFAESAFLGGASTLRGLHEQRYAGDASLSGSAEIRVELGRVAVVLPTDVGFFAFGDVGRVFRDGESSNRWARGWGGGVWLAPLRRSSTAQVSMARAEKRTAVYLGIGFAF
jgi:hypothetical protein